MAVSASISNIPLIDHSKSEECSPAEYEAIFQFRQLRALVPVRARVLEHIIIATPEGSAFTAQFEALMPELRRVRFFVEKFQRSRVNDDGTGVELSGDEFQIARRIANALRQPSQITPSSAQDLLKRCNCPLVSTAEFLSTLELLRGGNSFRSHDYSHELVACQLRALAPMVLDELDTIECVAANDGSPLLPETEMTGIIRDANFDLQEIEANLASLVEIADLAKWHQIVNSKFANPRDRQRSLQAYLMQTDMNCEEARFLAEELSSVDKYHPPYDHFFVPGRANADLGYEPSTLEQIARYGAIGLVASISDLMWGKLFPHSETISHVPDPAASQSSPNELLDKAVKNLAEFITSLTQPNAWSYPHVQEAIEEMLKTAVDALKPLCIAGSLGWAISSGITHRLKDGALNQHMMLYENIPANIRGRVDRQAFQFTHGSEKIDLEEWQLATAIRTVMAGIAILGIGNAHIGTSSSNSGIQAWSPLVPATILGLTVLGNKLGIRSYSRTLEAFTNDIIRASEVRSGLRDVISSKIHSLNPDLEAKLLDKYDVLVPLPPSPHNALTLPEGTYTISRREVYLKSIERAHFLADLFLCSQKAQELRIKLDAKFEDGEHSLAEIMGFVDKLIDSNKLGLSEAQSAA